MNSTIPKNHPTIPKIPLAFKPTLIVISGPTGVGKSRFAIDIAERLACPIVSADARQIYKGMEIGTAAPSPSDLKRAEHYMIGTVSPTDYYSAARYEAEVIPLLERLFRSHPYVVLAGGSMLYVDAVCFGIDPMPDVPLEIREHLKERLEAQGADALLDELKRVDPSYWRNVDRSNTKRILHALEVFYASGRPFSSFRTAVKKRRSFDIRKVLLVCEREKLYHDINERTLRMLDSGWLDETKSLLPYRNTNALDTIGYKELFAYLDGTIDFHEAIRLIQRNTRRYARKQMTWFRRDGEYLLYPNDASSAHLLRLLWLPSRLT